MKYNSSTRNILLNTRSKWLIFCIGVLSGCTSAIISVENMDSPITDQYPIHIISPGSIVQEKFNSSDEKHVDILKHKVDKIDVYLEVPGFQCTYQMYSHLNNALYDNHLSFPNMACVFIAIDNSSIQTKTIDKQASKINSSVDDIRQKLTEEIVKKFKLGESYFDKFRETWIGFSQGGPIAFEAWWYVYNKHLEYLKVRNYTLEKGEKIKKYLIKVPPHRLVLCNTGLFGCSSLDPADSIIEHIPVKILPDGIKDLSKTYSTNRVAERWMALNTQNCLLAGNLSNTQVEKKEYVKNMFVNMNLTSDCFNFQDLIIPFLPAGDSCFSKEDQFPKQLKERGIQFVSLAGHHAESLLLYGNIKILAIRIVNWPS